MNKGRLLARWVTLIAVLAAFCGFAMDAVGVVETTVATGDKRADIVVIDSLGTFGDLEEAPVVFLHDEHTAALEKMGKLDCKTCHEVDKDRLSPKFKRVADTDKGTVKDIYHSNCIGCHKDLQAKGQKTGPTDVTCRGCHSKEAAVASNWQPIDMDKSLHFRHVDSKNIPMTGDVNCGSCHHELDKASDKLVYVKGAEGSCTYCHKEEAQDKVSSIRTASHTACVSCHLDMAAEKIETGPLKCAGCHAQTEQDKIKVVKTPARIKRDQPDSVLLTVTDKKALEQDKKGFMAPVAFDHKAHEQYNDNCKVCHHEAISSCASECHTLAGSEKGEFVKLETAMHDTDSMQSCVGCHNQRKVQKDCAGCHDQMPKGRMNEANCETCHDKSLSIESAQQLKGLSKEDRAAMADAAIKARKPAEMIALEDIPEKVAIGDIVDQFEAAEFPHRKIVETMMKQVGKSDLAGAFHTDKATLCQGCHHNSPASVTPPRCASCHSEAAVATDASRPGLKAAFHQQCIGCHKSMELEKPAATACADCHKERKK